MYLSKYDVDVVVADFVHLRVSNELSVLPSVSSYFRVIRVIKSEVRS